ncbi:hypothetical protein PFISCL1PPCAC_21243, partial [Pristionchus fissidentatus]
QQLQQPQPDQRRMQQLQPTSLLHTAACHLPPAAEGGNKRICEVSHPRSSTTRRMRSEVTKEELEEFLLPIALPTELSYPIHRWKKGT